MDETERDGVTLDICGACGATWFDRSEIAALGGGDAEVEHRLRQAARARTWCRLCGESAEGIQEHCGQAVRCRCPRCEAMLSVVRMPSGDLDLCFGCGGFLVQTEGVGRIQSPEGLDAPVVAADPVAEFRVEVEASAIDVLLIRMRSDLMAGSIL